MPTVAKGAIGAHNLSLAAGVETVVTFLENIDAVDIISDGAADVFYTLDNTAATVNGANCYRIPSGAISLDTRINRQPNPTPTKVRLIAAAAVVVSVQRG